MLLTLIVSLTVIQSIVFTNADESLVDLPLKIPNKNILIHATITDTDSGDVFYLQEYISPNAGFQGKIEIESKADSTEVHYSSDLNDKRLVIQETLCDLYKYESGWDKKLPGVNKPLLNLLLLLGPSVLYRISHGNLYWSNVSDANVRGTMMHGSSAVLGRLKMLKVTTYYKHNMDPNIGISWPSRIIFEGRDPGSVISTLKENLIMDIHLQEENDNQLDSIVQIPPGIGCPIYLAKGLPLPSLSVRQVQIIAIEKVDGPTSSTTKNEFYIDDVKGFMRLVTTSNGIKVDAIYDYNLGIIYVQEGQGCLTTPLSSGSPGINENGYYSLDNLLWLDKNYRYLGQLDFEHRSGFRVKAWEAIEYDITIASTKYNKIVTTLYFSESSSSDTFNGYVLVGSIRNSYKKGSANDYILVETITRDFYDFQRAVSEAELSNQFQLSDCFPDSTSRIELDFQVFCREAKCLSLAQERPDEFKRVFQSALLNDKKISPVRVSNVDLKFGSDRLDVSMTFLPGPNIDEPFRKRSVQISKDFLKKLGPLTASNEKSCLTIQASIVAPIRMVIYCNQDTHSNCYHLEAKENLIEDTKGLLCDVWDFPLNNLYRVGHELTLEEIHKNMLDKANYIGVGFYNNHYDVNNVLDVTQSVEEDTQFLYAISRHSSKLKADGVTTVVVPGADNYGSCYRACVNEDENLCESFSFCETSGNIECLVTSKSYDKIEDAIVDGNCNIYSKNHLYDYHEIRKRRFKSPTSISKNVPLSDCATFCYASEGCYSFQYCKGLCTFAGFYTDSATEYREDCAIYSPKVAHKYQVTGDTTVVDIFHTEFNLNMEQCAALCDDWDLDDEPCRSFNFCPKGRQASSCFLSKYTVQDGKTVKGNSNDCHNYQLIDSHSKNNKGQNSRSSNGNTSSGGAFGIIMLFLFAGLAVGFVAPIGYRRLQTLPSFRSILSFGRTTTINPNGFGWSVQVNDEDSSRV